MPTRRNMHAFRRAFFLPTGLALLALAGCSKNVPTAPDAAQQNASIQKPSASPSYQFSLTALSILLGPQWGTHAFNGTTIKYLWFTTSGQTLGGGAYTWADNARLATKFGDGQCVAAVRALTGAPASSTWNRGARVLDNPPPAGTAIATFTWSASAGRYVYTPGHCAVFKQLNADGSIVVWHQNYPWNAPLNERTITHNYGTNPDPTNSGNYYVVQ